MQLNIGNIALSIRLKKREEEPPQSLPTILSTNPSGGFSRAYYNSFDSPRMNLLFIRETVSACMHARSDAMSKATFHAYRISRDGSRALHSGSIADSRRSRLESSHPLTALLAAPNPLLDMSDLLELTSQWLDATGNALILKVRDQRGIVRELWPLAALNYQIEKGADGMPSSYSFQPMNTNIPVRDIIHIRRADLRTAPFFGHAILSDILDTARADTAVRLFQERYFANDSVPRAVLRWPQGSLLTQEQMNQVRNAWDERYGGPANTGKLAILPDGGEIEVLGSAGKELDFRNSKEDLRDAIRQAFKVPKIVLGEVDNVNLSNAETSYMVFMRDVIDATLVRFSHAFTRGLAREFSSDITIEHDNILPESEAQMLGRLAEVKQSLTIDEQRALLSLPPLPNNKGNVFLINGKIIDEDWQEIN